MRIYKRSIRSAFASGFVPGGPSTTRFAVATAVCKAIATCFGIPTVSGKTIMEIVKAVIWEDMGHNFAIFLAEGVSTTALVLTVLSGGIFAPIMVASGAINAPIIILATTRLFLMLACDVILILVKAFKESTNKCFGQPLKMDVENAANAYRQMSKGVHKEIQTIVPRHNMIKSFQTGNVRKLFVEMVAKCKELVTADIGQVSNQRELGYDSDDNITLYETSEKSGV